MEIKLSLNVHSSLLVGTFLLLTTGFAGAADFVPFTPPSVAQKIRLKAAVVLPDNLCSGGIQARYVSKKQAKQYTEAFCRSADSMTKAIFERYAGIIEEGNAPLEGTDVLLVPKIINANMAMAMMAWGKSEFVLIVEWTVIGKEGKLIWMKTVQGIGKNKMGTTLSAGRQRRKRLQIALDDLFANTMQQIQASPEISHLSQYGN